MTNRYKSVFDIIGPVMVGPSSSHTAGAVAIGQAGYKLFGKTPNKITVHYYDSFAQTHRGHGTDYAIAAGILGFDSDDLQVPKSPEIARQQGVDLRFVEEDGPSPIGHPNTAILDMSDGQKKLSWLVVQLVAARLRFARLFCTIPKLLLLVLYQLLF